MQAAAPAAGKNPSFDSVVRELGLGEDDSACLKIVINQIKDTFAELVAVPPVPGSASPAQRLAAELRRGQQDAVSRFFEYCVTAHEPKTGTAYLFVVADHERRLLAGLPEGLRTALGRLALSSLMDIDTGHDPFSALMERLLASDDLPEVVIEHQSNKFAGHFCHAPFDFATVSHTGDVYVCCPAWLRVPAGNLAEQPWEEVWNGAQAVALRESILDGSYRFCSEAMCPHLSGQTGRLLRNEEVVDPRHRDIIARQLTRMEANPRDITIQYDRTCNLTCPSCRCGVYKADREESALISALHERTWRDMVPGSARVTIAGDGDAFASPLYRKALQCFDPAAYPGVKIALITNGLLLTPEMWQSISKAWPAIESIQVSWNAATPETFRINQRGGEWGTLLRNLEHLSEARHRGEFPVLGFGYYVRDNNFREMREIVHLGNRLGVDRILFGKLALPSYLMEDLDTFRAMAVHLPSHPLHGELLEILKDPIFTDPIVHLTNLTPLAPGYTPHVPTPESVALPV